MTDDTAEIKVFRNNDWVWQKVRLNLTWYLGDGQNYDSSEPSNRATFSVLVSTDEETIYTRRD